MTFKTLSRHFPDATALNWRDWRWQYQNRITSPKKLAAVLGCPIPREGVKALYPMAVTPYYLSLIAQCSLADPVFRQCVPDARERTDPAGLPDPLREEDHMPVPGLIRRYPDRVLALVTNACAVYCRHCNRKRTWTTRPAQRLQTRLDAMVRFVTASPDIREVIISGGDPLTYSDDVLESILSAFAAIPHVEVMRIGSRMPAVLPMRITRELCRMLKRYRPLWFNTQFNHPAELTSEAKRACERLAEAGIPVSNQSVLLAGVNDTFAVMRDLLHGLQRLSVRPYYLFHCEPVQGVAHFRTSLPTGLALMEDIRRHCSGLALPQYVADVPGPAGKVPLFAGSRSLRADLLAHQDFFDNSR